MALTDAQLVAALPVARAVARRFRFAAEPDDLAQVALLRMWENRESFAGSDDEAKRWAGRIARRVCINVVRDRDTERSALGAIELAGGYYPRAVSTPEETCYAREVEAAAAGRSRLHSPNRCVRSRARRELAEALA